MKQIKRFLSVFICAAIIASAALTMTACQNEAEDNKGADTTQGTSASDTQNKVKFSLTVVDGSGKETVTEIETDEKTVGAALIKQGIVEGEDGPYGLYIKSVNGITADYDVDGTYWAFYVNGQYASKSADLTDIVPGADYMLKVEK